MTPRQRAIADLLCREDRSYQEAWLHLGIARSTMYQHAKAMLRRYGVQSMRSVCFRYATTAPVDLAVDGSRAVDV